MKCCETWDRRKLKIYKPILLPSTGELRSREVVRVWRPLRTHKMLKKQYENTFSNWLKQRQSFLSDKNESIRANEQEEEEEEGQLKSTYHPPSVADANINETPKLRHWLAARNVGSRDPTRKWQEEVAWSKNPRFHNAQHEWTLSAFQLSPPQRFRLGIPIKIAITEKIDSARGTIGRGERREKASLLSSPFPLFPARCLSFFSPAPQQHKETSAEERDIRMKNHFHITGREWQWSHNNTGEHRGIL